MIEVVECITELADEMKNKTDKDDLDNGQLIAYAEVLSIIKSACAGYDLKGLGLDYDIDKRYL